MPSIVVSKIDEFVIKIKEKYPELVVGYVYYEDEDEYDIWHTDSDLQFSDKDFAKFSGILIKEIFYDNDIYNISFGYDFDMANSYYKRYKMSQQTAYIPAEQQTQTSIEPNKISQYTIGSSAIEYSSDIKMSIDIVEITTFDKIKCPEDLQQYVSINGQYYNAHNPGGLAA